MARTKKIANPIKEAGALSETVTKYLATNPMMIGRTELGPGARAMICIADEAAINRSESYYLYAECRLPSRPNDLSVGYNRDDLIRNEGVMVFKFYGENRQMGACISLEKFMEIRPMDERTIIMVRDSLRQLQHHVTPDEGFVDEANEAWRNKPRNGVLIGPRYLH